MDMQDDIIAAVKSLHLLLFLCYTIDKPVDTPISA